MLRACYLFCYNKYIRDVGVAKTSDLLFHKYLKNVGLHSSHGERELQRLSASLVTLGLLRPLIFLKNVC